jgi:hypothetical protein
MAHTTYLVVNVCYVIGRHKNQLERASTSSGHKTKHTGRLADRLFGLLSLFCANYLRPCFVEVEVLQTDMFCKVVLSKVGHLAHVH